MKRIFALIFIAFSISAYSQTVCNDSITLTPRQLQALWGQSTTSIPDSCKQLVTWNSFYNKKTDTTLSKDSNVLIYHVPVFSGSGIITSSFLSQSQLTGGYHIHVPDSSGTLALLKNGWGVNGNAGITVGNFIGSTNDAPLIFKTNNIFSGWIDPTNYNTCFGSNSGNVNISGSNNTGIGAGSMTTATTGSNNTGIGYAALNAITTASDNTAVGAFCFHTVSGSYNTGMGYNSCYSTTTGTENTAIGEACFYTNTTGNNNCAFGQSALETNVSGSYNCAFGQGSLQNTTATGSYLSAFGYNTQVVVDDISFCTVIGANATGKYNRTIVLGDTAAQNHVLIGTSTPNASAGLQINSTVAGFLPPRMTTTQKNAISSPAEGLVVYDLTLHKLCVFTGSAWETITSL